MRTRTLVVVASDLHIQSTVGLCPPQVRLDDGGYYRPSLAQEWLWQQWLTDWEFVKALRRKKLTGPNDKLIIVLNGDVVDGFHHNTNQVWTKNRATAIRTAVEVLEPVRDLADEFFMVRGTETHVGPTAEVEETIAQFLGANQDPVNETYTWWNLPLTTQEGIRFSFSHHGPMGRKPWTKDNRLNSVAHEIESHYRELGYQVPHVHVQSHQHRYAEGHGAMMRVIATPAWQLKTAFIHKVAAMNISDFGLVGFMCERNEGEDLGAVMPVFRAPNDPFMTYWIGKGLHVPAQSEGWKDSA